MWIAIGFVVGFYLWVPLVQYLRRKPLTGTIDPQWQPDPSPVDSPDTAPLERVGFSPPIRLRAEGARSVAHMSLVWHKDETTVATTTTMIADSGRRNHALIFRSHLSDGRVMITTNQRQGRLFPSMPYHASICCRTVRDPVDLWKIHQRRLEAVQVVNPIPDGDAVAYVNREARRLRDGFIQMGYIRKESDGTERVTLLGAALIAWRRLFPWKQVNQWRDARAAAAYLS